MPKNQGIICGAVQLGEAGRGCLLCPRWARPGRVTHLGSRTHFYALISLLFHRKFNKQICPGIYKAASLSGPGSSSQDPGLPDAGRLASGVFWRAGLRWLSVRAQWEHTLPSPCRRGGAGLTKYP